mgnify:CR=1 FL=1
MRIVLLAMFSLGLYFSVKSQDTFQLYDTVFAVGQKQELKNVRYALGGHNQLLITDSLMLFQLDSVVQFLKKHIHVSVEIGVHTDHRGSDTMNEKITRFRSEYIRDYLVYQGIRSSRITVKGYGESQPIITEEAINKYNKIDKKKYEILHQRNCRTEIKITAI